MLAFAVPVCYVPGMPPPPQPAAPLPGPLTVRLVRAEERGRWQHLLAEHHYLPGARMVGEALWYGCASAEGWPGL